MLKVHTRNLGTVTVLCLQGQMVNGETATLRNAVNSHSEVRTVVLDLARVTTIDAAGLGVMLEVREQTEAKGIGFKIMNVSKLIGRVLEVTRLDSVSKLLPEWNFFPRSRGAAQHQ